MELDRADEEMARFLREHGVEAMAAWPDCRRERTTGPVVLVSLTEVSCEAAGLQDYLGQWQDGQTGQLREIYGRRAKLLFKLNILAAPEAGVQACRTVFRQLVRVLQEARPLGLRVQELTGGEIEFDEKEGLLRFACSAGCSGWLWCNGDETQTLLDFTLRGEVRT